MYLHYIFNDYILDSPTHTSQDKDSHYPLNVKKVRETSVDLLGRRKA